MSRVSFAIQDVAPPSRGVVEIRARLPQLPPLTMAEAWKKYARGDQDALRYHLERMDDLREALSCMRWNRLRKKWASKHAVTH